MDLYSFCNAQHLVFRFNDLIAKNSILQQFLENENFNTHANNLIALKDLESDLVKLEVCLKDTAQEKEEVSADVAELQHHIKLWTSKIAFEKQTQVLHMVVNIFRFRNAPDLLVCLLMLSMSSDIPLWWFNTHRTPS
jgi:hypothetical protein